jgi:hypothetical protein
MAFLTPITNWTCSGPLILPAFSISTAEKIIERSKASTSGFTPCSSIWLARLSISSGLLS